MFVYYISNVNKLKCIFEYIMHNYKFNTDINNKSIIKHNTI